MTRKYKAGRARGTRKSTYNKKEYQFGNFSIGAKRNLTAKQYKEEVYNKNKTAFDKAYESALRKTQRMKDKAAEEAFRAQYKDSKDWFMKITKDTKSVSGIKKQVETYFGEEVQRFRNNAWMRVMASEDYDRIQAIFDTENETFDINKLNYRSTTGLREDGYYEYITNNGTIITIKFSEAGDSKETGYVEIKINGR